MKYAPASLLAALLAAPAAADVSLELSGHRVLGEFETWSLPGESMGMARFGLHRAFTEQLSLEVGLAVGYRFEAITARD